MGILKLLAAILVCSVFAAACTSTDTPTPEPTQVLIPATDTAIPSSLPPTDTPAPTLPHADDLNSPTPTNSTIPASTDEADASPIVDDPVAAELVGLAKRRVAQELNLPTRRIQLVEVKFYTWADNSLGCPLPGQSYTQITVDGYRIVLAVDDKHYIFHTDFDRVMPCNAADEKLPGAETTPEATEFSH